MFCLDRSLRAFGTAGFESTLKQELAQYAAELPLQRGLAYSDHVADEPLTVLLISQSGTERSICVRVGLFYQGLLAGCSCADDPTPANTVNEYCEVELLIDRATADTTVSLLP
jgi:hypothetical protein